MAIWYDVKDVQDFDAIQDGGEEQGKTETLMWLSAVVGYGWQLTEDNLDTAWARVFAYQAVTGSDYLRHGDLVRRVGMKTNGGQMTATQWNKHLAGIIAKEATRQIG